MSVNYEDCAQVTFLKKGNYEPDSRADDLHPRASEIRIICLRCHGRSEGPEHTRCCQLATTQKGVALGWQSGIILIVVKSDYCLVANSHSNLAAPRTIAH